MPISQDTFFQQLAKHTAREQKFNKNCHLMAIAQLCDCLFAYGRIYAKLAMPNRFLGYR